MSFDIFLLHLVSRDDCVRREGLCPDLAGTTLIAQTLSSNKYNPVPATLYKRIQPACKLGGQHAKRAMFCCFAVGLHAMQQQQKKQQNFFSSAVRQVVGVPGLATTQIKICSA